MRPDAIPGVGLLERAGARANPVLVKEVRAALRGRAFAIGFSIVLLLALIASTFAMIVGGSIEDAGAGFGLAYLASVGGIFALGAHGLVPFSAMASMSAEHDEGSLELLQLSGISPGRLVMGKLGAAAVQAMLIYAAFLPFLAFAFLLQGVDLVVLGAAVFASFSASIAFSAFGILLGGVCRWRWMRVLGYVLLAIVLMAGVQGMFGWIALGYFTGGAPTWRDFLLGLAIVACFTALALVYTSARLQHAEENRSTAFRVLGTAALVVACAFGVASGSPDELFAWALGGFGCALPSVILGLTEETRLPRAVLARARRRRTHAWFAPWLPGGGRAVLLLFVDCAIVLAACVAGVALSGGGTGGWWDVFNALAALELWLCFVLLVPAGMFARWLDRAWVAMLVRIACVVFPLVVILLPTFVRFVVGSVHDPFGHAGNPGHVVRQFLYASDPFDLAGFAILFAGFALGIALNAPRVVRSFGEVRGARARPPPRRADRGDRALKPGPEARRLGALHRLALLADPQRGATGERLARGTGASLEFQDRRAYQAGDDVRHVDWRALARTDQLLVRQHREEVLPRVEILLDPSRSMAVEDAKAQLAVDVAALLSIAAQNAGFRAVVALAGDRPDVAEPRRFEETGVDFTARTAWPAALSAALATLRGGSMRVLVSDFLFPHDARDLVRPLAARGGGLALVQILGATDATPEVGAAVRLVDSETDATREIVVDARIAARYAERLERLTAGLTEECRRAGARYVRLGAGTPLAGIARSLALAGILDLDGA